MNQRYAVVKDGQVINVILWDGETEYTPDEDCEIVLAPIEVAIGWSYSAGDWSEPEPTPSETVPTEDPAITAARHSGVQELMALGVSAATARAIMGLPAGE